MNSLNYGAGDVPVPEDPREIEAALRAGRISYRLFPYLEWRFGARGRAFTRSDSAWLVWLTRHDQEHVRHEIGWLKSILSNRGMPSTILEQHLKVLHRQLVRAVPAKAQQYTTLKLGAGWLRHEREASLPVEDTRRLVDMCIVELPLSDSPVLQGAARLFVAAIADQISGVQNAIQSLESWLADVARLRTVAAMRQGLSPAELSLLDSKVFAEQWPATLAGMITASGVYESRTTKA